MYFFLVCGLAIMLYSAHKVFQELWKSSVPTLGNPAAQQMAHKVRTRSLIVCAARVPITLNTESCSRRRGEQKKIPLSSCSIQPVWPGGFSTMLKTCGKANFQVQVMKPFNIIAA